MDAKDINFLLITGSHFWDINQGSNYVAERMIRNFPSCYKYVILLFPLGRKEKKAVCQKYGIKEMVSVVSLKVFLIRALRNIMVKLHIKPPYFLLKPFKYDFISKQRTQRFVKKNKIDALVMEYIWYEDLIRNVSKKVVRVQEFNDVQYLFYKRIWDENGIGKARVSERDEIAIADRFDIDLAISRNDYDYFHSRLSKNTCLLYLPSIMSDEEIEITKKASSKIRLGFVGGDSIFNVEAGDWIVTNLASNLDKNIFEFNFYGNVCNKMKKSSCDNVFLRGKISKTQEIYENNDLMLNPTFQPGGLKTKNVESLKYGTPIMTTTIGSRGLESAAKAGVMFIADTPEAFLSELDKLAKQKDMLIELSNSCQKFFRDNFSFNLFRKFVEEVVAKVEEKKGER